MTIRTARAEDAAALLEIYAYYVKETAVTFDYEVPDLESFRTRMLRTLQTYPYLVAEDGGRLIGYAYAGTFKDRAAYDWCVESTVYVSKKERRKGTGRLLMDALEEILARQHVLNVNACIGIPREDEDPYLTFDSVRFHEGRGYRPVGTFHDCGYKFGRWYHMVWMEKMLGDHMSPQPGLIPFPDLKTEGEIVFYGER